MSASSSTDRAARTSVGRRRALALLLAVPLAGCGKKGGLTLLEPDEPVAADAGGEE